MHFVKK